MSTIFSYPPVLIHDADDLTYIRSLCKHPVIGSRDAMTIALLHAYGLLSKVISVKPRLASIDELESFHDEDYVSALLHSDEMLDDSKETFGLIDDCAAFNGLDVYTSWVCGGSLAAADALIDCKSLIAIHWGGGWHHARRGMASGFCYGNDIVLAIQRLRDGGFGKVLYVDLDVHHGDGVEEAFKFSKRVATCSFHHYAAGFFPGTGSVSSRSHYNLAYNVPLKNGTSDSTFERAFSQIVDTLYKRFRPDAVLQCGVDGLHGDPNAAFNLSINALDRCLHRVLEWKLPTLLLGGGGYHPSNAARAWTRLTYTAITHCSSNISCSKNTQEYSECCDLSENIPMNSFYSQFAPSYRLSVAAGCVPDSNTPEECCTVISTVLYQIESELN